MYIRTARTTAVKIAQHRPLVALLFFLLLSASVVAQPLEVTSPDNTLRVVFTLEDGAPFYRIDRLGRTVVRPSRLGFVLKEGPPLDRNLAVTGHERQSVDDTWEQPWGETRFVRNRYHELRVALQETTAPGPRMTILFRVYNDGVGFRYEWPAQEALGAFEIMDERTEFALAGDPTAWWIPAYQENRYEYLYESSPLSEVGTVHTPLTMETEDGLYLSIHEAALIDFSSMTLARTGGATLEADLVPWSDGVKVKAQTPHRSPWRTIQIGDAPGELIASHLILNLNAPNRLGDVTWIEPGKYVGIWWEMHLGTSTWGSGPKHGATTENVKRYIDFAAEHGFDGVLVEGWNKGWDGDWAGDGTEFSFTESYPDFDLAELADYARERGVRLIGHHETGGAVENYERQMEEAFALYEEHGVRAVKTGYVAFGQNIKRTGPEGETLREWHHGQYMVRHHQKVAETAARRRIAINAHEPIKDTGLRRTYPNLLSREGARGQEYNSPWGGGNGPEHTTILPFTRMLSGPMDFTPGIFDLDAEGENANVAPTTLAKQLALYVVLYSPIQMAADLPENYRRHLDAFQFIKDVPADWAETVVLHARIGDYVTIARKDRAGENWYLGAITDGVGRSLEAPLYFLDPGRPYVAEIYADGMQADWQERPLDMAITKAVVDSTTVMALRLAPGGGQAVRFRPATPDEARQGPRYRQAN